MARFAALIGLAVLLGACGALAATAPPPVITVKEVTEAPKLDGILDDACWQGLPEYSDFHDETTKEPVKISTSVRICRDKQNIYVAFHATYPEPNKIPAHEKKRNGRYYSDDCVWADVDSSHMHLHHSDFICNSIGTQFDYIEGGSINKVQWRGDWRAAAKTVEDGYNVEMAIPFSMLKYKKGQNTFGLCFERWLPREKVWACWPDIHGEWDTHYFADWTGVAAPYIAPKPVGMGYITSATGGDGGNHTRGGVDVKYPFGPDKLGQLSIKPDLGTIEQDVESVDFWYTERLLSDYRPFFREWDLGSPPPLFYSRRIEDFDIGGKVVSLGGSHNFELLNTRGAGNRNDTMARYVHPFGYRSELAYGFADHRTPDHDNTVQFCSEWFGWKAGRRNHRIGGSNYFSHTSGVPDDSKPVGWKPDGWNNDFQYYTDAGNGSLGGTIRWARVESNYNGELGLTPEKDVQGWGWGPNWWKEYRNRKLQSLGCSFSTETFNHLDGSHFKKGYSLDPNARFKGGYGVWAHFGKSDREDFHDSETAFGCNWNGDVPDMNGNMSASIGRRAGGDHTGLYISQKFKLLDGLVLGLSHEWSRISAPSLVAGIGRQFIGTLNYDLTPERSIGGRLVRGRPLPDHPVLSPADLPRARRNIYFIYRQQVRRGMDIYIIYGDPNAEESIGRITVKLVEPLF